MTTANRAICNMVIATIVLVPAMMSDSPVDVGFFWHVSDLHYDKDYATNGTRDAMCHYSPNQTEHDDIGPYGDSRCDAPKLLIESAFSAMRDIQPEPDYILWTGDNLPHLPDIPWSEVYSETRWLGEVLSRSFPNSPIVPTLGNHDCSPPNDMRPDNMSKFLSEADFKSLLPSSAWGTFEKAGYYSWTVSGTLRLVCLNTVLWFTGNLAPVVNGSDEQLAWLHMQLQQAQELGEKVYISGHVAPGFNTRVFASDVAVTELFRDDINEMYQDLISNFSDTVAGQFFGHLHGNSFVLISDADGQTVNSAQVTASVTPWTPTVRDHWSVSVPTQPMVRLYKYDRHSARLLDYTVYYMDLDKANLRSQNHTTWGALYTLTTQYGVPDASTASMVAIAERLRSDSLFLDMYIKLGKAFKDVVPCDSFCRRVQLCATLAARAVYHAACLQLDQGNESQKPRISILVAVLIGVLGLVFIGVSIVILLRYQRGRMVWSPS
ncbi:acid sphingomyelinase-like phosphodiesterase 3b [Ixodes scapularis]|uniref:acid sphingomyelinase-like phosphodiesterase 3b n=1 Tax=Ixodes scapularis TaxID=6945 RepID=UPI001A9DF229|nr:acid sphingomyelinase-like phosphodiesterase 3b [Ixodes scapularis]